MAQEIQKMLAQENEKEKISDALRKCVGSEGQTDAVFIKEQQPLQEMIQNDKGFSKCASSDGTLTAFTCSAV